MEKKKHIQTREKIMEKWAQEEFKQIKLTINILHFLPKKPSPLNATKM